MTKQEETNFIIKGNICYSLSNKELCTVRNGYAVCVEGNSCGVYEELPESFRGIPIRDYGDVLIIPGMVDLHIHAPQFAFRGLGMDLELMDWLQQQAFPEEMKYADLEYADKAYGIFSEQMRNSATTRACIFATRHREATKLLMDYMENSGLCTYVGKVSMDQEAPEELCEPDAKTAAMDTILWLEEVKDRYQRTSPILTPRFIPSCSEELLERLTYIQKTYDLPVQSHLSENPGEIEWVLEHCPYARFYGDAYDRYGLFGRNVHTKEEIKTVMAHGVYPSEEELERIRENGVYLAHCPASNMNLSSGIAPVRRYLDAGVRVGLGSDVAGGHSESVFRAMTDAIQVSKLYWRLVDSQCEPLTFEEVFYMATRGGGEFFGQVGSFEKGFAFDAVVLDDSELYCPMELSLKQRLERAVYLGLDRTGIRAKYVSGRYCYLSIR